MHAKQQHPLLLNLQQKKNIMQSFIISIKLKTLLICMKRLGGSRSCTYYLREQMQKTRGGDTVEIEFVFERISIDFVN